MRQLVHRFKNQQRASFKNTTRYAVYRLDQIRRSRRHFIYLWYSFLRTRRSYTVKLRACSYRIYCCHGTQSSSAISQHAGSSALAARLRDGCSEVSTVLKAPTTLQSSSAVAASSTRSCDLTCHFLRLYSALCCSYTCCFAVAILAASLRLY